MSDQALPMGAVKIAEFRRETIPPTKVTVLQDKKTGMIETKSVTIGAKEKVLPEIKTLAALEQEQIENVLNLLDNNKARTAVALGITVKTLYNKLHHYGLFEKYASLK